MSEHTLLNSPTDTQLTPSQLTTSPPLPIKSIIEAPEVFSLSVGIFGVPSYVSGSFYDGCVCM